MAMNSFSQRKTIRKELSRLTSKGYNQCPALIPFSPTLPRAKVCPACLHPLFPDQLCLSSSLPWWGRGDLTSLCIVNFLKCLSSEIIPLRSPACLSITLKMLGFDSDFHPSLLVNEMTHKPKSMAQISTASDLCNRLHFSTSQWSPGLCCPCSPAPAILPEASTPPPRVHSITKPCQDYLTCRSPLHKKPFSTCVNPLPLKTLQSSGIHPWFSSLFSHLPRRLSNHFIPHSAHLFRSLKQHTFTSMPPCLLLALACSTFNFTNIPLI